MRRFHAYLGWVALFIGLLVGGCATGRPIGPRSILLADLPMLKGRWEGYWQEGWYRAPLVLEITHVASTGQMGSSRPNSLIGTLTFYGTFAGEMPMSFSAQYASSPLRGGELIHYWGGGAHLSLRYYDPETQELFGSTWGSPPPRPSGTSYNPEGTGWRGVDEGSVTVKVYLKKTER